MCLFVRGTIQHLYRFPYCLVSTASLCIFLNFENTNIFFIEPVIVEIKRQKAYNFRTCMSFTYVISLWHLNSELGE